MSKTESRASARKNSLLSTPREEHFVQFYTYDHVLISSLEQYIRSGLGQNETCIVVATYRHQQELDRQLEEQGVNTLSMRQNGRYITYDAADTLSQLMQSGSIDRDIFLDEIGDIMIKASENNRPVRVFGEMVALLWKKRDIKSVMHLEKLWNELADRYAFSLFCAYPMMYFVREIHQETIDEISTHHTLITTENS